MKKFICEFWASPTFAQFTPGALEVARNFGYDCPSRQLMIEVCEGNSRQRVEEWARAIANERDWRYIETTEVTKEWMQQIKQLARSQDRRAIRICIALDERPWLERGQGSDRPFPDRVAEGSDSKQINEAILRQSRLDR